jgi:glycosyltransferase involved in cell wall biosynthesis
MAGNASSIWDCPAFIEAHMERQPLVSVIVPFLNAEKFLREAVESVLAQTYPRWEILLVDDGSSDTSTQIAKEYARREPDRIRCLAHGGHENRGTSASRNLALHQMRGEYVALLDADDVWLPPKLEKQVAILNGQPGAGMLYGRSQYWHGWTGRPEDIAREYVPDMSVLLDSLIQPPTLFIRLLTRDARTPCPCSVLVRREVAERVGGFEDEFPGMYDDQAFFSKISLQYPVFASSECLEKYRLHPDSCYSVAKATGQRTAARRKYLEWLERYLTQLDCRDETIWQTLRTELRPFRHPLWHRLSHQTRQLKSQVTRGEH